MRDASITFADPQISALVWQAKNDKAKGNGKAKAAGQKKKPQKASNKAKNTGNKAQKKEKAKVAPGQAKKQTTNQANASAQDRAVRVDRMLRSEAPADRDIRGLLGTASLLALAPGVSIGEVSDSEIITYRNCPPGLAKKDPPCVPRDWQKRVSPTMNGPATGSRIGIGYGLIGDPAC
ncbi:hypothetical protein [Sulfitobacter aestuariivivens]|uniref:hypothetical protein n=1 Tax=Sulfitobacter aestuariivivens TaxID=2766981 RepID=UPI00361BDB69